MKKVVKTVVEEEYRTRNVIKFGLTEEKDENVSEQVQEIFAEIGLKEAGGVLRQGPDIILIFRRG